MAEQDWEIQLLAIEENDPPTVESWSVTHIDSLIRQGGLDADGLVRRPGGKWEKVQDVPEFADALAAIEAEEKAARTWLVRIGDKEYKADGVQTVAEWASQGRVTPDTMVFNPWNKQWVKAKDEPKMAKLAWPAAKSGCMSIFLLWVR